MDKKLKTSLVLNLILIVIILTLAISIGLGTFSVAEETKKVFF